jgi:hypothetical protein
MISRVPLPTRRSGVIGLAIAGDPDRHLSPWQEAVGQEAVGQEAVGQEAVGQEAGGQEVVPDKYKNGCANEATGLTLGLFAVLFQDVVVVLWPIGTQGSVLQSISAERRCQRSAATDDTTPDA